MIKILYLSILFQIAFIGCYSVQNFSDARFKDERFFFIDDYECRKLNLKFSKDNLWYYGLTNENIDSSYTVFKNIKKGVSLAFDNNNESCNSSYRELVIFSIKIRELNQPTASRDYVINAILTYLSLTIIPNYNDYSYSIEYKTNDYIYKTNRNFLSVISFFNIFLFFRYKEPFIDDFKEITNEFLFNYYEYHKVKTMGSVERISK